MVGYDLTVGNGLFVCARGYFGSDLLSTTDGMVWKQWPVFGTFDSIAFGNGTYVAAVEGGAYPSGIYQSEPVTTPMITAFVESGSMHLLASGELGRVYRIQTSTNLSVWSDRLTVTKGLDPMELFDPIPPGPSQLFYRVVSP